MELTAREIAHLTDGEVVSGDPDARASSYAIDSRVLEPGACFVALKAARDGHDFVGDAVERGAAVVLVSRRVAGVALDRAAVVRVDDPLRALGALGARARDRVGAAVVVGITGSAGKTGTKDLTAAALGRELRVHASPGSYNNEAGVPLTLLDTPEGVDAIVLELGARARGDIARLCAIARPIVGVVTNVGLAHAGPLGGPAGVSLTKGELFEALPTRGLGVLDADDKATDGIASRTRARVLRVSAKGAPGADVRATRVVLDAQVRPAFTLETPWGHGTVQLAVHGDHQVVNALLAGTVALEQGVPFATVVAGLESVRPGAWRMEILHTPAGSVVLNDAYNANPSSMEAALRALARVDTNGRRIAVLGEMRELGGYSDDEHARIGRLVAELGIDAIIAVGADAVALAAAAREHAPDMSVATVADADAALESLRGMVGHDDAVLVKGSRAVGLERVAHALGGTTSLSTRREEPVR